MTYEIDREHHQIKITGSVIELKQWMLTLDEVITRGNTLVQIEEDIKHLDLIHESKQFNFNAYERIYYSRDELLYVPNVTQTARDYWFENIILPYFEKARKVIGK